MVVWFAHVRVGHRQLPIPKKPLFINLSGGFFLCLGFNFVIVTAAKNITAK